MKILSWILPLLSIFIIFMFIVILSIIIYLGLEYLLLPKTIINEPIYFNFAMNQPSARINILSNKKQWSDIKEIQDNNIIHSSSSLDSSSKNNKLNYQDSSSSSSSSATTTTDERSSIPSSLNQVNKRFLIPGVSYSINISMLLAKSVRNNNIGKFMIFLKLYDTTNQLIAKSSRPVIIPYQSDITTWLENIVYFPFCMLGFQKVLGHSLNSIHIQTQMINNYFEPKTILPSTVHHNNKI